jgi:hypothetical protein
MSVTVEELERRMRPGGWSPKPMLLAGESLAARLEADAARLGQLGTTAAALGARLADLLASAEGSDWFQPRRYADYDVELRKRRGLITCPWAEDEYAKCAHGPGARPTANEFVVRRVRGGLALSGYELSAHLVRDHGFFGGAGTVFRIEPDDLAVLLVR